MDEPQTELPHSVAADATDEAQTPAPNRVALGLTLVLLVALGAAAAAILRMDEPTQGVRPLPRAPERTADPGGCGVPDPERPADISLDLPGRLLDFGDVEQGQRETRIVTFHSTGRGPLCVHDVRSGCGCFLAELDPPDKLRFEPGEAGRIKITMNSERQEGDTQKHVTLYTNRMDGGRVAIACRANVVKGLIVTNSAVRFEAVPRATPSEATVVLYAPREDGPFEVLGVEGTRPGPDGQPLAYTFETTVLDDPTFRKLRLVITHPGLSEVSSTRDALRIRTSHPRRREITLESYLQVVDRIRTSVRTVSLGLVGPGRESRPVRVWFRPGTPDVTFRLMSVHIEAAPARDEPADGLGFLASFGQEEKGWFVDVRHDGRARRPGMHEAVLVVTTDDVSQRQIRLKVRADER